MFNPLESEVAGNWSLALQRKLESSIRDPLNFGPGVRDVKKLFDKRNLSCEKCDPVIPQLRFDSCYKDNCAIIQEIRRFKPEARIETAYLCRSERSNIFYLVRDGDFGPYLACISEASLLNRSDVEVFFRSLVNDHSRIYARLDGDARLLSSRLWPEERDKLQQEAWVLHTKMIAFGELLGLPEDRVLYESMLNESDLLRYVTDRFRKSGLTYQRQDPLTKIAVRFYDIGFVSLILPPIDEEQVDAAFGIATSSNYPTSKRYKELQEAIKEKFPDVEIIDKATRMGYHADCDWISHILALVAPEKILIELAGFLREQPLLGGKTPSL